MHTPPVHTDVLTCAPLPESVRLARWRTAQLLTARGWHPEAVRDAELATAELTANALRHVPGQTFEVHLACDDSTVLIEVTDRAPHRLPRLRSTAGTEHCGGRGLHMVAAMAVTWGVAAQPASAEKTVWALLAQPGAAGRISHASSPRAHQARRRCLRAHAVRSSRRSRRECLRGTGGTAHRHSALYRCIGPGSAHCRPSART